MTQNVAVEDLVAQDNEVFWPWVLDIRKVGYELYMKVRSETGSVRAATMFYYRFMCEKLGICVSGEDIS